MGKINYKSEELNESVCAEDVLPRIAQGDKQAVIECFERYDNLIWKICGKFISNQADREDVVQEIFIDIWRCASKFDAVKSPEITFVILIARRRIIDRLRKLYRQPLVTSSEITLNKQLISDDYQYLHRLVSETPALKALSKLKTIQKQMINMAVFEGMSHTEIAGTIGLPLGTVKTNIRRGFQKIRHSIKGANSLPIQN